MTIKTFWVVAEDGFDPAFCVSQSDAVDEIGGWSGAARILRISPETGVCEDETRELAWSWFHYGSMVDDEPAEAFVQYIGDAVQERRDAAEDPLGVWAKADRDYAERVGK